MNTQRIIRSRFQEPEKSLKPVTKLDKYECEERLKSKTT